VVLLALIVGGAAYAFSESQTREYKATTQLGYGRDLSPELQVVGLPEPQGDEAVRIATEAQRVASFDIADATAKANPGLGYDGAAIHSRVTATPTRGTLVIVITATGDTAQRAAQLGNAYSQTYLRVVRGREREQFTTVERALRSRLTNLSPADRAGALGASVRSQLTLAALFQRVGTGLPVVIGTARASAAPAEPQTTRNVLFGILFGAVVGIGLMALRSDGRTRNVFAGARRVSPPSSPER
jgi:capsular polysaccharide biosynthesis protein